MQTSFICNQVSCVSQNTVHLQEQSAVGEVQQQIQDVFQETFKCIPDQSTKTQNDPIYLITNEKNGSATYHIMQKNPVIHEAILAVSGFFGLNIASMRGEKSTDPSKKLSYLIFIDCSSRVQKFWNEMNQIICQQPDQIEALRAIRETLITQSNVFWETNLEHTCNDYASNYYSKLEKEVKEGVSWLSTLERFKTIQRLFQEKHFLFKPIDLCDKQGMQKLCQMVKALNIKFDTVYLSNVKEYAEASLNLPGFIEAVGELRSVVSDETLFIDTKRRTGGIFVHLESLNQRVTQKFLSNALEKRFVSSLIPAINLPEFKSSKLAGFEMIIQSMGFKTIAELGNYLKSEQEENQNSLPN